MIYNPGKSRRFLQPPVNNIKLQRNVPLLLGFTLSPLSPPPTPFCSSSATTSASAARVGTWFSGCSFTPVPCMTWGLSLARTSSTRLSKVRNRNCAFTLWNKPDSHYLDDIFKSPSTPCCNDLVIMSKCTKAAVFLICCTSQIHFPFFLCLFCRRQIPRIWKSGVYFLLWTRENTWWESVSLA